MSRVTPVEELNLIEAIVAGYPTGVGIAALEAEITQRQGVTPNRRTLQRHLQKLLNAQRLTTEGDSVALVYKPIAGMAVQYPGAMSATPMGIAEAELYVPMSPEGAAIRDQVRRPLMHRSPVGYQRPFLESYHPGVSYYLPASLRQQLHLMGRTAAGERPAGTYARAILSRLLVDLSWASSH
jgi:hypothetical protein